VRNRIFIYLLTAFVMVIATVALAVNFSVRRAWENSFRGDIERNLRQKAAMMSLRIDTDRRNGLSEIVSQEAHAAGARATVIDSKGTVLADSEKAAEPTKNYALLPEFSSALRGEVGANIRTGSVIGVPVLYIAVPVTGGAARLAYPLSDAETSLPGLTRGLLWGVGIALLAALALSGLIAQAAHARLHRIARFADHIAGGELTARIHDTRMDEIGQLGTRLDHSASRLEDLFRALRESQRQLETLLNSMQDAVIAVNSEERVQWANSSMNRLIASRAKPGVLAVEIVRDPDFLRAIRSSRELHEPATARASSILHGHTFDVTATPLPGGGAVAVLRDLTETERVEKTRRDFIANVSHELRTPLTSIQGYAETLLDAVPDAGHSREFLEIIRKNATRMSRLTEDLLTLARVESGEHRFDVQPVTTSELLNEAVRSFQEIARSQHVELRVEDHAATQVSADSEAVHQVFANLVENALKYGASGGLIVVGARPAGEFVEFYVQDCGPGIPSEHLPRLFERFYRVDKARSRESGGTGLGLAIAKHIVFAHGGVIRAESELNHGATFFFTLPCELHQPEESELASRVGRR
jgi:two-component system, OmpR family, phosphate regulon sensor histidine kinase PhoR